MSTAATNGLAQMFNLRGRRALVTGGNAGIGETMARALGQAGAQVLLVARREAELAAAAARLQDEGIAAQALTADLTDVAALRTVAAEAERRLGGIDIRSTPPASTCANPSVT